MAFMSTLLAAFCVAFSFTLASSDQVTARKFAQLVQYGNSEVKQGKISLPLRKLKVEEDAYVESSTDKDILLHKKLLESSSGYKEAEKEGKHAARKGTWREWVEDGPHKSEYFTMDYHWVRRRRPIHNKQSPLGP